MMKKNEKGYMDDPTPEEGFDGLYCGKENLPVDYEPESLSFNLREAAKYVRENSLEAITEEIKEMFKK